MKKLMNIKSVLLTVVSSALVFTAVSCAGSMETGLNTVTNGQAWKDAENKIIQAHDGIIKANGKYYWYGQNYQHSRAYGDGKGFESVKCYVSDDLVNWELANNCVLRSDTELLHNADLYNINVAYNAKTKNYVMTACFDSTNDGGRVMFFTSPSPDGQFVPVIGSYTPGVNGVTIGSMFIDDDGEGYYIVYGNDDGDAHRKMFVYKLNWNYIGFDSSKYSYCIVSMGLPKAAFGRASIVKHKGMYYIIASYFGLQNEEGTGAEDLENDVNKFYTFFNKNGSISKGCAYSFAPALNGNWSAFEPMGKGVGDVAGEGEFSGVFNVSGEKGSDTVLMFNNWNFSDLSQSGYSWRKLEWEERSPTFAVPAFSNDYSKLSIDAYNGIVETGN